MTATSRPTLMRLLPPKYRGSESFAWLVFATLAALTVLVYWPALSGGYLFDDSYYLQSPAVMVTSLRLGDWVKAALSQSGANQFRALSMLSFAANYFLTGPDPWWYKITNLGMHVLNGLLLFQMLKQLLRLHGVTQSSAASEQPQESIVRVELVAAVLAGLWLLAPINFTAVAYVSQRIESLANVFVFLGLLLYLRTRRHQYTTNTDSNLGWIIILGCTAIGMLAKESAALLPLYTGCIEFALTRFRNRNGRLSRSAIGTHVIFLLLPLLVGLFWISQWDFSVVAHIRTFTIAERLLTEPRVLVDYLRWTLVPNLDALTFYHDDIPLSRGLLDPPTTLAAIVFLAALLAAALWQRKRRPLFCLGILWFFAGHAMTGTIIPLELVFEHRNYFPSAGILLAAASLLKWERGGVAPRVNAAIACSVIALFAFTTLLRAEEWSDPLRLAYAEAIKRPDSMRAQYGLAETLIVAGESNPGSPLVVEASKILERIVFRPDSGIGPAQALIYLNGRAHRDIDPAWWNSILKKLHDHPPSQFDLAAIISLHACMLQGHCPAQKKEMLDVFIAATESSGYNRDIMSAYADFAYLEINDAELAERLVRNVVGRNPGIAVYRENLVHLLIATGKLDKAAIEIDALKKLNHLGSLDAELADLEAQLANASKAAQSPASGLPVTPGQENR